MSRHLQLDHLDLQDRIQLFRQNIAVHQPPARNFDPIYQPINEVEEEDEEDEEEENEYQVEALLDARPNAHRKREYLVTWRGYELEDAQWVAAHNVVKICLVVI